MPVLRTRLIVAATLALMLALGVGRLLAPGAPAPSLAQVPGPAAPVAQAEIEATSVPDTSALAYSAQPAPGQAASDAAPAPLEQAGPSIASAPAAAANVYKVAIQVGHWKNNELPDELSRLSDNTGAYGGGRSEVSINLDVANRVAKLLRARGVLVDLLPATVPSGYNADAFIAIHADGNSSSAARGFKISTRWRSVVAVHDARLVEMITDSYAAATGLPEDSNVTRNMRGYYAYSPWRPNWRISNYTPGAIVELGFMTNATDRNLMFNQPDRAAKGVADGISAFLASAYGSPRASRPYGQGLVDKDLRANAPAFPTPRPGGSAPSPVQTGDWKVLLMGRAQIRVASTPGGGAVVATLSRGQFYHASMRKGDYYRLDLPGGAQGWVHRNYTIIQME